MEQNIHLFVNELQYYAAHINLQVHIKVKLKQSDWFIYTEEKDLHQNNMVRYANTFKLETLSFVAFTRG